MPAPTIDYASPLRVHPNRLARVALGLAIGGFVLLGPLLSVPAIIVGHIARRQAQERGLSGHGVTTAALIIAYANLGLCIFVFGPLMYLGMREARLRANEVRCMANLRSIAQACQVYAVQNQGWLPPDMNTGTSAAGFGSGVMYRCPFDPASSLPSYTLLVTSARMSRLRPLNRIPLARDIKPHPDGRLCVVFCDGHAEILTPAQIAALPAVPAAATIPSARGGGSDRH